VDKNNLSELESICDEARSQIESGYQDKAIDWTMENKLLLEENGFRIIREKGSIRYYGKSGLDKLIRIDYHGSREIPTGTCNAILKASGLKRKG
jgi:predicted RNA binding protein YcfA (HicA-like mRNA interferase family)